MRITALVSQKGGSGKTTLALHLAYEAARRGERVLLVDLDPQASATKWADRRSLAQVDVDVSSEHPTRIETVLKVAEKEGYASVFIDTAPNSDQAAARAARWAHKVLIPCRPSVLDLDAIGSTLELCAFSRLEAAVILNAAPVRSRVTSEARDAIEKAGGVVASTVIHERVAFRHCLLNGGVAQEYEPDGLASAEVVGLYNVLSRWHENTPTHRHADMATHQHDVATAIRHAEGVA